MNNDLMKLDSISEIKEMVSKKKEEWIDIKILFAEEKEEDIKNVK